VTLNEPSEEEPGIGDQSARSARATRAFGAKSLNSVFLVMCALLVVSIGTPSLAWGQDSISAHDVAQLVDHHYNQLHSLRAGFTESYEGLGMSRSESGTLLLLKPGRMRWDYSQPAGKLFLIDGKYAWFYVQGEAQVERLAAKQLDDLRSPLRFLLGHTELEKEMTGLRLDGAANAGSYTLVGQPKGQTNRVRRVSLSVAAHTGVILAIEIDEEDGAVTKFSFTGEQPNAPVPENAFHFTPPAGVPVVDALPPV
jgi:outer membrane lipoprotein carrier protein